MKWTKKGNEFDEFVLRIPKKFQKNIYVFGTGRVGERLGLSLNYFNILGGFIDNNVKKQGNIFIGKTIETLEHYLENEKEVAIVIATTYKNNSIEIEHQLKKEGLIHREDYFFAEEFAGKIFPVMAAYYYNSVYMNLAQIVLTERCTLKCKKCAHACYNVENTSIDMTVDEAYRSADTFFENIDYVGEFVLIGGEPFLYKNLAKIINYIGERYRAQIGIFAITTNGTIVPTEEVLMVCKKYNVVILISNYSKTLPRLKTSHRNLINRLNTCAISYVLSEEDSDWMDYGFDYLNKNMSETEMIDTFDRCLTPCREIRGSKLYFCVMARSVSDNLHFEEGVDDFLDLKKITGNNAKKIIMEFNCGYSDKGYLDMCHRCHGIDAKKYLIPVAEQL